MMNLLNQSVDFEVCEAFRGSIEHDEPICAECGHLADDHERTAGVTHLPRHRAAARPVPVRKAS